MSPLSLTVVTACRNAEATIGETIGSVAAQEGARIEHLVIDGASTDGTMNFVRAAARSGLVSISEPDTGIYDAMNKGLSRATGDVIAFLNADDAYAHCGVASRALDILAQSGADGVFGDVAVFSGELCGRPYRRYRSGSFRPSRLALGIMPAHPAMFVRRSVFERFGGFSTGYRIAGDFEFVARAFGASGASYRSCPEVWVKMRAGGASTRDLAARMTINRETLAACQANGIRTNRWLLLGKYPFKLRELILP